MCIFNYRLTNFPSHRTVQVTVENRLISSFYSPTHMLNTLGWKNLEARRRDSRLNLMYNITHNNTAVSAEELGMVAADGRTKANHHFKFRAMGAVTAQLHGSFVARTIPEWNRLPAAAADAVSPTSFHSRLNALPANFWPCSL